MNKTKIILAAIGGVACVAAMALAYLIWDALGVKSGFEESYDSAVAEATRLSRLPVYPGPDGIRATASNEAAFAAWRQESLSFVERGDRLFDKTTPPAFKTFIVQEARRLASLPGSVGGKLVKPNFEFGFKDYVTGGKMPSVADLPRLQREWDDVTALVTTLAESGALEILSVEVNPQAVEQAAASEEPQPKKGKKRSRKQTKKADADGAASLKPIVTRVKVDFLARPSALVKAVNAFASDKRFVVVDNFSFDRALDTLAQALGGGTAKDGASSASPSSGRRGRGRRRAAAQEAENSAAEAGDKKGGSIVTDPLKASPLKVSMSFSVYDFRSLDKTAKPASAQDDKED